MASKKHTSLDRVLGRFDSLDPVNMANLVQRLARERRLLEDIFNILKEGVLVVDADGRIQYANQTASRLIGLRDEEIANVELWRVIPGLRPAFDAAKNSIPHDNAPAPDTAPRRNNAPTSQSATSADTPAAQTHQENGQAPSTITREIELTYPEHRIVRLYMVPFLPDGENGPSQFAIVLTDITAERQTTEARIENESTSSMRLLAAGVAHELGNPLNSLNIHLQLLERRLKKLKGAKTNDIENLTESIGICQGEVTRLDGIIDNFLNAIRPHPPRLAETNLGGELSAVLRFQQRELGDRGITVEVENMTDLPAVMADTTQLKQVFFNITKNAMEAMQPGGVLRIRARHDDDNVYLLFGDTGAGIKQEDLPKLFQPYHTTKQGGHGLGLMIVQRIMREHGGQIAIESKEGVGTLVTLQFSRKDRRVRMLR